MARGESVQPRRNPLNTNAFLITFGILGTALLLFLGLGVGVFSFGAPIGTPPVNPIVTIESYSFTWSSPPSTLCDGYTTYLVPTPFSVSPGSQFYLGWQYACFNTTATYRITSIDSITPGFSLTYSNLPVTIAGTTPSNFNVTLAAPSGAYDGPVMVQVTASAA